MTNITVSSGISTSVRPADPAPHTESHDHDDHDPDDHQRDSHLRDERRRDTAVRDIPHLQEVGEEEVLLVALTPGELAENHVYMAAHAMMTA
jgi:hypothetical protein